MPDEEYRLLVDTDALARHIGDPAWVVVDCRFSLADPGEGRRQYRAGHIPGAFYLHLDEDLSGLKSRHGGRHPLAHRAMAGHDLGRHRGHRGEYEEAERLYLAGLEASRAIRDPMGVAVHSMGLGRVALEQGRIGERFF